MKFIVHVIAFLALLSFSTLAHAKNNTEVEDYIIKVFDRADECEKDNLLKAKISKEKDYIEMYYRNADTCYLASSPIRCRPQMKAYKPSRLASFNEALAGPLQRCLTSCALEGLWSRTWGDCEREIW